MIWIWNDNFGLKLVEIWLKLVVLDGKCQFWVEMKWLVDFLVVIWIQLVNLDLE